MPIIIYIPHPSLRLLEFGGSNAMKHTRFLFVPACLVLLASTASAQGIQNPGVDVKKEKKTCRQLMPTGSIMSTRVCNTAVDWAKFDAIGSAGADDFHKALRMTTTGSRGPGPGQ
ncbi:hypothetical protein [Sphingomonas sp. R86520]|uniref:hypothetical protein n=1 Tax=Sphingomonas sp. R86520 TaxID=3093859 RepID=UPI0036D2352A